MANTAITRAMALLSSPSGLSNIDLLVIELQFVYGLRISEVLSIRGKDILPTGAIRIYGKKGSHSRMVVSGRYTSYVLSLQNCGDACIVYASRWYYYRLYKSLGLVLKVKGSKTLRVTHSGRHALGQSLEAALVSEAEAASLMGHRSTKSAKYYRKKKA